MKNKIEVKEKLASMEKSENSRISNQIKKEVVNVWIQW